MIHFKNKKVKYGILLCVALVLVIVFILAYRNANTRLPAPVEEYYEAGDVVEHNGLEICVANLYFGNMNDIVDKKNMPKKMRSDKDGLVIVFDVTNKKEENVNLAADFVPNVELVAYPIGYDNQGMIYAVDEEGDTILKPEETKTFAIRFGVSNSLVRQERRARFIKSDFYFDMALYPVHKAIIIHGAEKV